jgi:hypothetical protein
VHSVVWMQDLVFALDGMSSISAARAAVVPVPAHGPDVQPRWVRFLVSPSLSTSRLMQLRICV